MNNAIQRGAIEMLLVFSRACSVHQSMDARLDDDLEQLVGPRYAHNAGLR